MRNPCAHLRTATCTNCGSAHSRPAPLWRRQPHQGGPTPMSRSISFRLARIPLLAALLLVGAIALPATASADTPEQCAATLDTFASQVADPTNFTSLSDKDRIGLVGKLTNAAQKVREGKPGDALQKLADARFKVETLRSTKKVSVTDADLLLHGNTDPLAGPLIVGLDEATRCVNSLQVS